MMHKNEHCIVTYKVNCNISNRT